MVDSPAFRSMLRVGDRVLAVNDVSIDDLSHEKIVECIRKSGQRLRLLSRVKNTKKIYASILNF